MQVRKDVRKGDRREPQRSERPGKTGPAAECKKFADHSAGGSEPLRELRPEEREAQKVANGQGNVFGERFRDDRLADLQRELPKDFPRNPPPTYQYSSENKATERRAV